MSFRFNFAADSDDESDVDLHDVPYDPPSSSLPPRSHTLHSLTPTIPPLISYTTVHPSTSASLPRRELYDVKMQLMTSDSTADSDLLGNSDITKCIYEGGLKSWECSHHLTRYLSCQDASFFGGTTLELGCGSALPSLYIFQQLLALERKGRLVLADYNIEVLRLVTLPNLFLVWVTQMQSWLPEEGNVDVTPALVDTFVEDLEKRGIEVVFVSGGWGKEMVRMLGEGIFDIVLASETIYEPATTPTFTEVLTGVTKIGGVGFVAAKRLYFGVGGSVDDFVNCVKCGGAQWDTTVVDESSDVGVGRVIVKVGRNS